MIIFQQKTKLNEERSDIVGKFLFLQIKYLILIIVFLMTIILKIQIISLFQQILIINNFQTSFNYLSKDNEIGNDEIISNSSS